MKIFVSAALAVAALSAKQTDAAFPADVAALMDTTADPCDDFYQYTCGNWVKNYTLPADKQTYTYSFNGISTRNEPVIQDIIKQDWPLIGELYDSCMALDGLSAMGNKPLQKDLTRISQVATKKDLSRVAGELGSIGPSLFTGIGVGADARDATTNVLYAGSAGLVLPKSDYYTVPEMFASVEAPYRKYISTLVTLAGINLNGGGQQGQQAQQGGSGPVDTKYAEDTVISIEKQLATIKPTPEETDGYYAVKYSEAAAKWPLTFQAMTQGTGVLEKSALTVDSKVLLDSPAFMDRAEKLFNSVDLKDLKIYYSFLYVNSFAAYLGDAFVQAKFDLFSKALQGATVRTARDKVCSDAQITLFPDLIGKYYFLKMFDSDREQNVQLMVNSIEKAMGQHIASLTWLDDVTRKEAAAKLAKVANLIGHSTNKKSYPFVLSRDNYFTNVQAVKYQGFKEDLARINKPVDRSEWGMSAATVNAYYSPSENKMVFPAAILQPPFYNGGSHPVQNFGAIGAVIGHELTHGFDNNGRHYDGDGNQREWWSESTAKEFEARATCMKNQYSQIAVFGESGKQVGNVNGNLTIGENIADNGGVSLSFDAYHDWVQSGATFNAHGVEDSEVDKLYFVSFAQVWCNKIRDAAAKQLLTTDVHSPKPARVNGVAMNSEQFAKTFQCKAGSKMNPEKKCKLW
jgi:endothelin-converting enzyme